MKADEIFNEHKKGRKAKKYNVKPKNYIEPKKPKAAASGPGPAGAYGTNTGYSGDGGVAESVSTEKLNRIKEFVKFCAKKLNLKSLPNIKLTEHPDTTALGYFVPDTNTIVVVAKNRHQMDIMRTLAHELVHLKQTETHVPEGHTGSKDENQANSMAGVLLRVWGKLHPDYFVEQRKFTELELAIMEGGGSIEDNKVYDIKKQLMEKWSEKYKRSINCSNPKGFSQRAHCQGRKKNEAVEPDEPGYQHSLLTMPANTLVIDTPGELDWYKIGQHFPSLGKEDPHEYGQSESDMVVSFADTREMLKFVKIAAKLGLKIKNIGGSQEHPEIHSDVKTENFADGKNPGRKGLAKRSGVNCKASVSTLRNVAKNSSGEKQRMAHWCANMKSGKAKK